MSTWRLVIDIYLVSWVLVGGYAAYVLHRDRHTRFVLPARARYDRAA
jgi:hypothetical protein